MPTLYPFETPPTKYYYTFGKVIGVYPTPETALSAGIRVHYVYTPTTLSEDNDTPLIRSDFHDAMVKYATANIIKRLNPDAYQLHLSEWLAAKEEAVTSHYVSDEVFQTPHKDY
tara:strand:- start:5819 stop:6160 length:342 start_codon:yes stop_codon:yes gene_type:complete